MAADALTPAHARDAVAFLLRLAAQFDGNERADVATLREAIRRELPPVLRVLVAEPPGDLVALVQAWRESTRLIRSAVEPTLEMYQEHSRSTHTLLAWQPAVSQAPKGWQPIETAPRGEYVLLWEPPAKLRHDGDVSIGDYVDFGSEPPDGYHSGWFDAEHGRREIFPTHWQPLPAPPVAVPGPAAAPTEE